MAENELGPRQRVELIERVSRELSQKYTFAQLRQLLRAYEAIHWDSGQSSKFAMVEEQLGETKDATILRIAADYGLAQPREEPSQDEATRLWKEDGFRLFISHTSDLKEGTHELAEELKKLGAICFVAHDAIEPGREWQAQIELALRTMDALALVTSAKVKASNWCDQEVGWALGSDKLVVPIKIDADPHGFVGKYQAINGFHRPKPKIAFDLACILASNDRTREKASAVVMALAAKLTREDDLDRFWTGVSAIIDNNTLSSPFLLGPVASRIAKDKLYRHGVSDAFAKFLRSKSHEELAKGVADAEIPF